MNLINIVNLYGYDFLFDKMQLDTRLDRTTVINSIMDYNGEFIPIYPDGTLFQMKIGTWSIRINNGIARMLDALLIDYNPIDNTDRYDTWTESTKSNSSSNISRETNEEYNEDTETSVSAYDSNGYTPRDKTTNSNGGNKNFNEGGNASENETKTYSQHLHGNIGVTTNQQMINDELELRKFNIYTYIAEDFFNNFMIGVID